MTALIGAFMLLLWLFAFLALLDIRKAVRDMAAMMKADRQARPGKEVAVKSVP